MAQTVYLNGSWMPLEDARIPVLDRGFIFGDGIYEVIPVYARRPFGLEGHLARLEASLSAVRIPNPHDRAQWTALVTAIVAAHAHENQSVYIQVTRGVAPRDHAFPAAPVPTVFMMSNPLSTPSAAQIENGVEAVTLADNRWLRCNIKSTSLLANCLLRQEAAEAGAVEAVLIRDGWLSEGSSSNVYAVRNGIVLAPPKDHLILPGITYDFVTDLMDESGIVYEIRPVAEWEVRAADELWFSSSSKEVLAITTLDGKPVGSGRPGPLFRRVHAVFQGAKAPAPVDA